MCTIKCPQHGLTKGLRIYSSDCCVCEACRDEELAQRFSKALLEAAKERPPFHTQQLREQLGPAPLVATSISHFLTLTEFNLLFKRWPTLEELDLPPTTTLYPEEKAP